jgi:putative sigma-54 modulation protein
VRVKGKNLTVTPALHDHVVEKMSKLEKYLDRVSEIEVELWTEQTREAAQHNHVEATTRVAGRTVRVTTADVSMSAAIDEAVDRLYRRLNRQKERMKSHHGTKPSETLSEAGEVESLTPNDVMDQSDGEIVRVKSFDMKPEFEDDAIESMTDLGHSFYVFLNARNEHVNVLYRRADGTIGLIDPRVG